LEVRVKKRSFGSVCGAGGGTGGVVIKLPPGAVITNYGSDSRLLLFYQRLGEILRKKGHGCNNSRKKVIKSKKVIFKVSNKTICDKKKSKGRKNVHVGAEAGVVIQIYGSAETKKYLRLCNTTQWVMLM
jgi:hypothetical protein